MQRPLVEGQKESILVAIFSSLMALAIAYLVFLTDGTQQPFPHLMYVPIVFSAILGNWHVSIGVALLCGALVSHWVMPLSISEQLAQDPYHSLFRISTFLLISLWTKKVYEHQKTLIERLSAERAAMHKIQQDSLTALIDLAETRDVEVTGQHLRRLKEYSKVLVEEMGVDPDFKSMLADTIGFHDIGKVSVRDSILMKPGSLDELEWEQMKKHTSTGASILQHLEEAFEDAPSDEVKQFLHMAREIALYHHERVDGTGYPENLKGYEIPLSARIAAICDVYDALRSLRPYKAGMSHEEAVEIIKEGRGGHFDPELVDIFLKKQFEFQRIFDCYSLDKSS